MIGLQDLLIKQDIKVTQLGKELGIKPDNIWYWIQHNKIPKNHLSILAERFGVEEEYLVKQVNDISTYKPRVILGFNEYEIREDITAIFLENKKGEKFETLIDTRNLERIKAMDLHWHLRYDVKTKGYYAMASERYTDENGKRKGRSKYLHMEIMKSDFSQKEYVDHKNHNTLDNREDNLRIATFQHNTRNRHRKNSNNKSGYRNVSWNGNTWSVQLQIEGKNTVLKRFKKDQLEEAGDYAELMRQKYYGEYAGKS